MLGRRLSGWPAALALVLALGGCASVSPYQTRSAQSPAPASRADARAPSADLPAPRSADTNPVARLAMEMIGVPYRYGGADPSHGFDCSGLVFYTYAQTGFAVPRTSQAQFKAARKISLSQASQGDLVFFQDQAKLSHVGIYMGNGLFVHAPSTGRTVSVASLDEPYYQRHLVAVGRLLPN
jgi:cell wall-associated NlpC family hydrolase